MNKLIKMVLAFVVLNLFVSKLYAQGFQTLEDKYGKSSSIPVQQKLPEDPSAVDPLATPPNPNGETNSTPSAEKVPPGMVYIGGKEWEIEDMIKQVSRWTGKFFMETGVKGKVTIIADGYMPVDLAVQTFYSALESNGYTAYETPGGVIRVIKTSEAKTKPKDLFRDKISINGDQEALLSEKMITRIITLNNISANEIYSVVKEMISKEGSGFAYPSTNSLIITDSGANIDHILKLIKELDTSGPQEMMDIIPIINADAKDIADKVKTIFDTSGEDTSAVSKRTSTTTKKRAGASSSTELQDVQAISQVIADERTNSVIVMGTKRMIVKVRSLIARLDTALAGGSGTLHVYTLKYANAEEMEETLSKLVSSASSSSAKDKKNAKDTKSSGSTKEAAATTTSGSTTGVELEGGVKIVADKPTNQLIITATPKDFNTLVSQVIAKLDVPRPSVYLEATIMSMDVTKGSTFGLSGLFGAVLGEVGGSNITGFASIASAVPLDIATIAAASGGVLGGIGAVSDATIEFTDSSGNEVSVPSATAVLQALKTNTDVNVLSVPSMLTLDNEEAKFKVGKTVPVVTSGSTSSASVESFSVDREDVGVILTISPQISDSNTIRLKITQEISDVISTDASLGPTLSDKSIETTVVVKDKQTIVIAGLMDESSAVSVQKVPILGDIPVLGNLFKTTTTAKSKSNLLIFITPYIVRETADNLGILKKKIDERNSFMEMNFGKKQQKQIRQAIQTHASELLEFKCNPVEMTNPCFADASYSSAAPTIQGGSKATAPTTTTPVTNTTTTTTPTSVQTTTTTTTTEQQKTDWNRPSKKKYKN